MDRWSRKAQEIRKMHLCKPDLQDVINFVEKETILVIDLLFSGKALHEYTKHPEKLTHVKAKKKKNCYTKADEKSRMTVEKKETVTIKKYKFCDGDHHCQFYHEITVDDQSSFLKKNRLCYFDHYGEISPKYTAQ